MARDKWPPAQSGALAWREPRIRRAGPPVRWSAGSVARPGRANKRTIRDDAPGRTESSRAGRQRGKIGSGPVNPGHSAPEDHRLY